MIWHLCTKWAVPLYTDAGFCIRESCFLMIQKAAPYPDRYGSVPFLRSRIWGSFLFYKIVSPDFLIRENSLKDVCAVPVLWKF